MNINQPGIKTIIYKGSYFTSEFNVDVFLAEFTLHAAGLVSMPVTALAMVGQLG